MQDNKKEETTITDTNNVLAKNVSYQPGETEQHMRANEMIRQCENFTELKSAVEKIGEFPGSYKKWDAEYILRAIDTIDNAKIDFDHFHGSPKDQHHGFSIFNGLTRGYGLRQQAIYIKLYDKH